MVCGLTVLLFAQLWVADSADMGSWPEGTFGVPRPSSDCPDSAARWVHGRVTFVVLGPASAGSLHSKTYHQLGPAGQGKITLATCLKLDSINFEENIDKYAPWPPGTYCIYQIYAACPNGFVEEWVSLALGDVDVEIVDPAPATFSSGKLITIHWCCRADADPRAPIDLPSSYPFMLLKGGDSCQIVKYSRVSEEYIVLPRAWQNKSSSTEVPTIDATRESVKFHFCYYEGINSFPWSDDGLSFGNYGSSVWNSSVAAPSWLPARQRVGTFEEAQLARDDNPDTCSYQRIHERAWWQLDLLQQQQVVAVYFQYDGAMYCGLYGGNIYVSDSPHDFEADSALSCARYVHTSGRREILAPCAQPVRGRYVTVFAHASSPEKREMCMPSCLTVCEVRVYVQESYCGKEFTLQDIVPEAQYFTSSNSDLHTKNPDDPNMVAVLIGPKHVELFSQPSWCAQVNDAEKFIKVDMIWLRVVTTFMTQGGSSTDSQDAITRFTLHYGWLQDQMKPYEEQNDVIKVFGHTRDPHEPMTHVLARPFYARHLKLTLTGWTGRPCMRLRLAGCPLNKDLYGITGSSVSVSSTDSSDQYDPLYVLDQETFSCWSSTLELKPWVTVQFLDFHLVSDIFVEGNPYELYYSSGKTHLTMEAYLGNQHDLSMKQTCETRNVSTTANFYIFHCKDGSLANRITLQIVEEALATRLLVCSINIFEKLYESAFHQPYSKNTFDVSCNKNESVHLMGWSTLGGDAGTFNSQRSERSLVSVDAALFPLIATVCPPRARRCRLPYISRSELNSSRVVLYPRCVLDQDGGYEDSKAMEYGMSLYQLFLRQMDTAHISIREIAATAGSNLRFHIGAQYQQTQPMWQEADVLVNPGFCKMDFYLQYHQTDDVIERTIRIEGDMVTYTSGDLMSLVLKTCARTAPSRVPEHPAQLLNISATETDCPGCHMQVECGVVPHVCTASCGYIASTGYSTLGRDSRFLPNTMCSWYIRVSNESIVSLEFPEFWIESASEDACTAGVVTVQDMTYDGSRGNVLGDYCDTHMPPSRIFSSWNGLILNSTTKQERTIFLAVYSSVNSTAGRVYATPDLTGCPKDWSYYEEKCFNFQPAPYKMNWKTAEKFCIQHAAHLASIMSHNEMLFIYDLLQKTQSEIGIGQAFIGLSDESFEGRWQWKDKSALVYLNWERNVTKGQPDGASVENCAWLTVNSRDLRPNWQDIPCALDANVIPLCKKEAKKTSGGLLEQVELAEVSVSGKEACEDNAATLRCDSGECVSKLVLCDGTPDCQDGSDESWQLCEPAPDSDCAWSMFQCLDGPCIPASRLCDTVPDCEDSSDEGEKICAEATCEDHTEFRCKSGQCIARYRRCDLHKDCRDRSDESGCRLCNAEGTFQCYTGQCIAVSRVCDGVIDCPRREDEEAQPCDMRLTRSCTGVWWSGRTGKVSYPISTDNDTFEVECDLYSESYRLSTLISPSSSACNDIHNISYSLPAEEIQAIKTSSIRCEQHIDGLDDLAGENYDWQTIYGQLLPLFREAVDDEPDCGCIYKDERRCWCKSDESRFEPSSGALTDLDNLPVMGLVGPSPSPYTCVKVHPLRCYPAVCKTGKPYSLAVRCLYEKDTDGLLLYCRDAGHLFKCEDVECPVLYVKCPRSFCLAARHLCDGEQDCPGGEDELNCGERSCPGMFRCSAGGACLPRSLLCDGKADCVGTVVGRTLEDRQDEQLCGLPPCPPGCTCVGLAYSCSGANMTYITSDLSTNARVLLLQENSIQLSRTFADYVSLYHLNLAGNGIEVIQAREFATLENLHFLDLSHNRLTTLYNYTFAGLSRLLLLNLQSNPLSSIFPGAFDGLEKLPNLSLANLQLNSLAGGTFQGLTSLTKLNISNNKIQFINKTSFDGLEHLKQLSMVRNAIHTYQKAAFLKMKQLTKLYSDDYVFCCITNLPRENCFPQASEGYSCTHLVSSKALLGVVWTLGSLALLGNILIFVWHVVGNVPKELKFLMMNLAVSDFLMAVYLLALASVDLIYRGRFAENYRYWKGSGWCQVLGCISTLASESSALLLGVLTADCFRRSVLFGSTSAPPGFAVVRAIVVVVWGVVITAALGFIIPLPTSQNQLYSLSPYCSLLHVARESSPMWKWSVAVVHCVNMSTLAYTLLSFICTFIHSKFFADMDDIYNSDIDTSATEIMGLTIFINFVCWAPINVLGVLATNGWVISGQILSFPVLCILPIKAFLNPILYLTTAYKLKETWAATPGQYEPHTRVLVQVTPPVPDGQSLDEFIHERHGGSPALAHEISHKLADIFNCLQLDGTSLAGTITTDMVRVIKSKKTQSMEMTSGSRQDTKEVILPKPNWNVMLVTCGHQFDHYDDLTAENMDSLGHIVSDVIHLIAAPPSCSQDV